MTDETRVAEELSAFARALMGKIAHRRRGKHWKEDAVQDLVLAGLQEYRDTGNIGLVVAVPGRLKVWMAPWASIHARPKAWRPRRR